MWPQTDYVTSLHPAYNFRHSSVPCCASISPAALGSNRTSPSPRLPLPPSHATGCNLGRHLPCFGRSSPWLMRLLSTDSAAALSRGGEERRRTPWCGSCCNRQAPTRRHLPLAVMRNLLILFCSGARFSKLLEKMLKSYENDRTYEDLRK